MFKPSPDKPHPARDLDALAALHAEARRQAVQLRREAIDAAWRAVGQALRRRAAAALGWARGWGVAPASRSLLTRGWTRELPPDPSVAPARCPAHTP